MKQAAKKALKHPLIYGSTIVVFGGLFANFFNFLFSFFMVRNISVPDYGVLQSIITLITFPALLANAINPVVIRSAGSLFAKSELSAVRGLYIQFFKFLFLIGGIGFIIFLYFLPSIGDFFKINDFLVLLWGDIIMFLSLLSIINLAFLQAKLSFGTTVVINFASALTKFLLGIVFVFLGFSLHGAIGALVISSALLYLLGFFPLRFIFSKKLITPKIDTKELFAYGIPSALTVLGLTSFISSDILLTKHFFEPVNAGLYAGLSQLGKIIFYLTGPICGVMFPIIVRKHAVNENFSNTFKLAMLFVLIPSVVITAFYFVFPNFMIHLLLSKESYLAVAPYLGFFGIYMTAYC
ncbi:MAG: oligosaccharide flippase family protein, partial [Candidatus Levyibacteriota bacterium]